MTMSKKSIKIGNAGGYWGDDPTALARQVLGGDLDYITMDFLAEVTMSIMQKQRSKNPDYGYARDFVSMLDGILPDILQKKVKIITNAGGVNPKACAKAIKELARQKGLQLKIVIIYGDDILEALPSLVEQGHAFENMESGEKFADVQEKIESANIYFGATSVVEALKLNPDIILTGRVTDTGITLAPMIHQFGWSWTDWDLLAAGIVAGHILECGSQSTGGNFTDWRSIESFDSIGYPVVEVFADGTFVVTKHSATGGVVSVDTVREQLFYEMGNPKAYLTPDVVADFSTIQLQSVGTNSVRVFGVQGAEPTPFYKVSMAYLDGYKVSGSIMVCGPNARKKAEKFAEIFWKKMELDFKDTLTEYIGWNSCHGSLGQDSDGAEIILRLSARDGDYGKLRQFSKLIPSLILGGPPGVCVLGGVSQPSQIVSYWPALVDKTAVQPIVFDIDSDVSPRKTAGALIGHYEVPESEIGTFSGKETTKAIEDILQQDGTHLEKICLARSGDKGDSANIGLIARSPEAYEFIKKTISADYIKNLFQELCLGKVVRYELDNMLGLNFLLEESLGGGGTASLRIDAQGKTFAQALLRQRLTIPKNVLDSLT